MTTIRDVYIPIELWYKIIDYFDSPKSIMNLGKVNRFFYHTTKSLRNEIKHSVLEFANAETYYNKKRCLFNYIKKNFLSELNTLLNLGSFHPNDSISTDYFYGFENQTAIDYAVYSKKLNIVKLFLKYNCDLNRYNIYGYTPLMNCVRNVNTIDDINMLIFLLKNGANPNIKHLKTGHIAMDYICNNIDVVANILRYYNSEEGLTLKYRNIEWEIDITNENIENYYKNIFL